MNPTWSFEGPGLAENVQIPQLGSLVKGENRAQGRFIFVPGSAPRGRSAATVQIRALPPHPSRRMEGAGSGMIGPAREPARGHPPVFDTFLLFLTKEIWTLMRFIYFPPSRSSSIYF